MSEYFSILNRICTYKIAEANPSHGSSPAKEKLEIYGYRILKALRFLGMWESCQKVKKLPGVRPTGFVKCNVFLTEQSASI